MVVKDILNEFGDSKEYKAWQKSFKDILQYIKKGPNDEKYAEKIMNNHFISSFMLYNGFKKAIYKFQEKEDD